MKLKFGVSLSFSPRSLFLQKCHPLYDQTGATALVLVLCFLYFINITNMSKKKRALVRASAEHFQHQQSNKQRVLIAGSAKVLPASSFSLTAQFSSKRCLEMSIHIIDFCYGHFGSVTDTKCLLFSDSKCVEQDPKTIMGSTKLCLNIIHL